MKNEMNTKKIFALEKLIIIKVPSDYKERFHWRQTGIKK